MRNKMPIRGALYKHQREAFEFTCRLFGLTEGGDNDVNRLCKLRQTGSSETKPHQKEQK